MATLSGGGGNYGFGTSRRKLGRKAMRFSVADIPSGIRAATPAGRKKRRLKPTYTYRSQRIV